MKNVAEKTSIVPSVKNLATLTSCALLDDIDVILKKAWTKKEATYKTIYTSVFSSGFT